MSFLATKTVIDAVTERLKQISFPDDQTGDDGWLSPLAGDSVFEAVVASDRPDLSSILNRLVAVTERIAAVVPGVESYTEESSSGRLIRTQRFTLMFSTQDFDPFADPAFFGETGLLRIAELVVASLLEPFGEARSPLRQARLRPLRGGSQLVQAGEGEAGSVDSAREVYFLEIEARMGSSQAMPR